MTRKSTLILVAHLNGGHLVGLQDALTNAGEQNVQTLDVDSLGDFGLAKYMERVLDHVRSQPPSHVYVLWSPDVSNLNTQQLLTLSAILSEAKVIYLQYEGWGRGKPVTPAVRFWLQTADIVLHSGGIRAISRFMKPEARALFVPPCYNHTEFADAENTPPDVPSSNHAVMIGNNVTKSRVPIPGLTGIGDGFKRWRTAALLHKRLGSNGFHLYGANWPEAWSRGMTSFDQQVAVMRSGSVVAISDHFQNRNNYASDRLTTAMLAGRPIVSSSVRDGIWLPIGITGLTFQNSTQGIVNSVISTIADIGECNYEKTPQTWEWVRKRLSTIQLGQFMVNAVFPGTYADLPFPWGVTPQS